MSYREGYELTEAYRSYLASIDEHHHTKGLSLIKLKELYKELLKKGLHGLCFSIYEEGQKPGDLITEDQVRRRMKVLKPYVKWIRSFSCIEGNEFVPKIAKEFGIKTLVGAWIGNDRDKNKQELEALISLAKKGFVDIAAVGNEVLYRKDISLEELKQHIDYVKSAIPDDIPVGYVDAYYEFSAHPDLTEKCDVILSNCYPFWEGCPIDYSLAHMQQMYGQALRAGGNKKVIITETGWPSKGVSTGAADPSEINFLKYFINTQLWFHKAGIESFYFSSFDENWKTGTEGDVGAYWGIWDKNENLKF